MKQIHYIFIFLIIVLAFSCKKNETVNSSDLLDPNGLPPCTTIGAETMGCLVNGVPWLPLKPNSTNDNYIYDISWELTGEGGLHLNFARNFGMSGFEDFLYISVPGIVSVGLYEITGSSFNFESGMSNYEECSDCMSELEITKLDLNEGIISGKFEFDLTNVNDSTDTLQIIQGRFDLLSN